jgi:hypothetical protein
MSILSEYNDAIAKAKAKREQDRIAWRKQRIAFQKQLNMIRRLEKDFTRRQKIRTRVISMEDLLT